MESEKVGLKLNIQKMKIMASSPITSWEIDGETVETVSDFIFPPRNFPDGPVVKTLQGKVHGFDRRGAKIPHSTWPRKKRDS